jgi:hypothetical protein
MISDMHFNVYFEAINGIAWGFCMISIMWIIVFWKNKEK